MSTQQGSSMTSVWDTLKAMKARRAAAETSAKQHSLEEAARKKGHQLLNDILTRAADARIARGEEHFTTSSSASEVAGILEDFHDGCTRDTDIAALMAANEERARANPAAEMTAIRANLKDIRDATSSASGMLNRAQRLANGLSGFTD